MQLGILGRGCTVDKRRILKRLVAVRASTMTHVDRVVMISLALIEI